MRIRIPKLMLTCAVRRLLHEPEKWEELNAYLQKHADRLDVRTLTVLQRDVREEHRDGVPKELQPLLELTPGEKAVHQDALPDASETLVMAAFNYCLGRRTYVTGDCALWLQTIWEKLTPGTQEAITARVEQAIEEGVAGDPNIDQLHWQALLHEVGRRSA